VLQMREEHTPLQQRRRLQNGQLLEPVCKLTQEATLNALVGATRLTAAPSRITSKPSLVIQIKNSQANTPADIRARTSDLKFKGTEMHQDFKFLDDILAQTDKLPSLKHCRELKVVDQHFTDLGELDPDAHAFPHLWPLYELLAEGFLTLSRSSSVLLSFIEPIVGGMGPGASSLRDC
jgi:hypothetical protein